MYTSCVPVTHTQGDLLYTLPGGNGAYAKDNGVM
jgi:hypothetical protein